MRNTKWLVVAVVFLSGITDSHAAWRRRIFGGGRANRNFSYRVPAAPRNANTNRIQPPNNPRNFEPLRVAPPAMAHDGGNRALRAPAAPLARPPVNRPIANAAPPARAMNAVPNVPRPTPAVAGNQADLAAKFAALETVLSRPSQVKPTASLFGGWIGRCVLRNISYNPERRPAYELSDTQNESLGTELVLDAPTVQGQKVDIVPTGRALRFGLLRSPQYDSKTGQFFTSTRRASPSPSSFDRNFLINGSVGGRRLDVYYTTYNSARLGFFESPGGSPRLVTTSASLNTYDTGEEPPVQSFRQRKNDYYCVYMPREEAEKLTDEGRPITMDMLIEIAK